MKRYVYHFCILAKNNNCWDGVAQAENKILSFEDYREFKKLLIKEFEENLKPQDISIQSLSLIGEEE